MRRKFLGLVAAAGLVTCLTPAATPAWGGYAPGYASVGPYTSYTVNREAVAGYGYRGPSYGGYAPGGYGYGGQPYAPAYHANTTSLFPNLPPVTGGLYGTGGAYGSYAPGVYRQW
jgi:hypothetical protein